LKRDRPLPCPLFFNVPFRQRSQAGPGQDRVYVIPVQWTRLFQNQLPSQKVYPLFHQSNHRRILSLCLQDCCARARLPGDPRRKSRVASVSNWTHFRSATLRMASQRQRQRPSNRAGVSFSRKPLIIGFMIYRYSIYSKASSDLNESEQWPEC
jgi:hypothetical protein